MGGFAAAVSLDGSAPPSLDSAWQLLSSRGTAGTRTRETGNASFVEFRSERDGHPGWDIAAEDHLTLVGDLMLFDTSELAELAGGEQHDDPRTLVLRAFREHGPEMLPAIDGDFAFGIWDEETSELFIARDRFGIKPVFFARAGEAIVVGSTQLAVARASGNTTPDEHSLREYITGAHRFEHWTFFDGVQRIRPAHTLTLGPTTHVPTQYWDLDDAPTETPTRQEAIDGFRQALTDSVHKRLNAVNRAAAHLSGGLDSTAITAAAASLVDEGLHPERLITISACFPGLDADESGIIATVAAGQPFEHVAFDAATPSIDDFEADMAGTGLPIANPARDLTATTRALAREHGAQLVLTGNGGDEVAADERALTLMVRSDAAAWGRNLARIARRSPRTATRAALVSAGSLLPDAIKRRLKPEPPSGRAVLKRGTTTDNPLGAALLASIETGRMQLLLETQEAMFAEAGVEVTHPFLDRGLLEYVASFKPSHRPISDRSKTLTREAFRDDLPPEVTEPATKTVGNSIIETCIDANEAAFDRRFATMPDRTPIGISPLDYDRMRSLAMADDGGLADRVALWQTWAAILWLNVVEADADT